MRKIISKIILVTLLVIAMSPLTVKAGYQANKGGKSIKTYYDSSSSGNSITASTLFNGIRDMESGTLGSTKNDKTDNMDCHMAKNTEWGTAAMLAASIYGEVQEGKNDLSTTGNDTGVFQMADSGYELVAGIWYINGDYLRAIRSAGAKYYDSYSSAISKPGDATTETLGWKKASTHNFISNTTYGLIFCRSWGSLFGYSATDGLNHAYGISGNFYPGSRAVVVFGEGL